MTKAVGTSADGSHCCSISAFKRIWLKLCHKLPIPRDLGWAKPMWTPCSKGWNVPFVMYLNYPLTINCRCCIVLFRHKSCFVLSANYAQKPTGNPSETGEAIVKMWLWTLWAHSKWIYSYLDHQIGNSRYIFIYIHICIHKIKCVLALCLTTV